MSAPKISKASAAAPPAPPTRLPVVDISPKKRFQAMSTVVAKHRELVVSDQFQIALDHALLQYQTVLTSPQLDGNAAAQAGLKLQGAQEFIRELKLLGETEQPVHRLPQITTLKY